MSPTDSIAAFNDLHPVREYCDSFGWTWGYRRLGQTGKPVFLLPGASGTSLFFLKIAEALALNTVVIIVDYPGPPDPGQLGAGLCELWDALEINCACLVGSSYAAYWLPLAVARRPERVSGLVISNGFTSAGDLAGNVLFDPTIIERTPAQELQSQWLDRAKDNPHPLLSSLLVAAMSGELAADDLKGRLLNVSRSETVPPAPLDPDRVMILDCKDDALIDEAARTRLRNRYPDARHHTMVGGHYPYVTEPETYRKLIETLII